MKSNETMADKGFLTVVHVVLFAALVITLYPFWSILILSISSKAEAVVGGWHIFTMNPTLYAYADVIKTPELWRGFYNTVVRVLVGSAFSVFLTAMTAYPLSKKDYPFNRTITAVVLFTMIFNGGLIPTYLLIKSLGMMNSIAALILPSAVTAYNLIIVRNFLRSMPPSLEESAKLDGASDWLVWWKIILPLSKPVLATITLWQAVAHWNAYLDVLLYITDSSKIVLQVVLRRILLEGQSDMFINGAVDIGKASTPETLKAAIIMVSTLPIIIVYPFLQKYFVKGIMLGSVKG